MDGMSAAGESRHNRAKLRVARERKRGIELSHCSEPLTDANAMPL